MTQLAGFGRAPEILGDCLPAIVNVWIPLTDATPLNS